MHGYTLIKPPELLVKLSDLGCPGWAIHATRCRAVLGLVGSQVHCTLGVRKSRLGAVWGRDVEIVDADVEIHELALFRRRWFEWYSCVCARAHVRACARLCVCVFARVCVIGKVGDED